VLNKETVRMLLSAMNWGYDDAVWDLIGKLDRDRQKHREIKSDPKYNARKKIWTCSIRRRESS